jgi:hypothetical protein
VTNDSGKKKNHTYKNQAIILRQSCGRVSLRRELAVPKGEDIVDVVVGELGPKSDISIWREQKDKFKSLQKFRGDKADVGEAQIQRPHKKPASGKLTEKQKAENKESAKKRGVDSDRNNTGLALAKDLIGCYNWLASCGYSVDGDPYGLFIDYCQSCSGGNGWSSRDR